MRPTVLIVDDHAEFRASARALLEGEGYAVVGEAANGVEALSELARLAPEIVLLDIQLPGPDGFDVAEQIAVAAGSHAVILISSREAAAYGPRLAAAPVAGFIPKHALSGEVLASLVG